jgi:hypothetical protein
MEEKMAKQNASTQKQPIIRAIFDDDICWSNISPRIPGNFSEERRNFCNSPSPKLTDRR